MREPEKALETPGARREWLSLRRLRIEDRAAIRLYSKTINPLRDPLKDLAESWLGSIIESAAILVRFFVELAGCRIAQNESLVLCDVLVVGLWKSFGLMGLVVFGADECLYVRSA